MSDKNEGGVATAEDEFECTYRLRGGKEPKNVSQDKNEEGVATGRAR